jgi:hypothetical protein
MVAHPCIQNLLASIGDGVSPAATDTLKCDANFITQLK